MIARLLRVVDGVVGKYSHAAIRGMGKDSEDIDATTSLSARTLLLSGSIVTVAGLSTYSARTLSRLHLIHPHPFGENLYVLSISQSPVSTTSHSGTLNSLVSFLFNLSASLMGDGSLNERTNSVPAALPRKV